MEEIGNSSNHSCPFYHADELIEYWIRQSSVSGICVFSNSDPCINCQLIKVSSRDRVQTSLLMRLDTNPSYTKQCSDTILPIVCSIGVVGNITAVIVLLSPFMR